MVNKEDLHNYEMSEVICSDSSKAKRMMFVANSSDSINRFEIYIDNIKQISFVELDKAVDYYNQI